MQSPSRQDASLRAMFAGAFHHRVLICQLVRREVTGRYRGSWLGLGWSLASPLVMLAIYTFFFSAVFKARWGMSGTSDRPSFAFFLFVGLIIHGFAAECINRAPSLVLGNTNFVKRVVFPLEVLAVVATGSALFHAAINVAVLLIAQLMLGYSLQWTVVFLPLVLLPLVFISLGLAWLLSSLGVYLRDVGQVTGFITTILLFLSPVFYPVDAMPEPYRDWLLLNPLTFIIEQARAVVLLGELPNMPDLALASSAGLVVAWVGFWWFQRTRNGFADVI